MNFGCHRKENCIDKLTLKTLFGYKLKFVLVKIVLNRHQSNTYC